MGQKEQWGFLIPTPQELGVKYRFDIDRDGVMLDPTMPFDSLPSSHSSMGFKVYPRGTTHNPFPHVALKASPAKLLQVHNIYGSDCLEIGTFVLLAVLEKACSTLFPMLDILQTTVSRLDYNYFSRFGDEIDGISLITFIGNISIGQISSNNRAHAETAYFNKGGQIREHKVYLKDFEIKNQIKETKKNVRLDNNERERRVDILEKELNFSKNTLRFETSVKSRYLKKYYKTIKLFELINIQHKRNKNNKKSLARCIFNHSFKDIIKAIRGKKMTIKKDQEILENLQEIKAPYGVFNTYKAIKAQGFLLTKKYMPKNTFYRHIKLLQTIGISRSVLQNINATMDSKLPLFMVVDLDFSKQHPDHYQEPTLESLNLTFFANSIYNNQPIFKIA